MSRWAKSTLRCSCSSSSWTTVAERVRAGREQLVEGEVLDQADGDLVVVRAGHEVLRGQHLAELPACDRNLAGRLHVRLRGEEARSSSPVTVPSGSTVFTPM
jgi:hypothetical protein